MKRNIRTVLSGIALVACVTVVAPAFAQQYDGYVTLTSYSYESDGEARDEEREDYEEATEALDERRWDRAISMFARVAAMEGKRADGALYWKAWAEARSGKRKQATETLARLKSSYPNSRWLKDAAALKIEVQGSTGSPDKYKDDELKLIALHGLMERNPDKGAAMIERMLASSGSPSFKEQALYLLADYETARSIEIISSIARGNSNPDLQLAAIRYLGIMEAKSSLALLDEVYDTSKDLRIREEVVRAWYEAEMVSRLEKVAKSDSDPRLRMAAIHALGDMEHTVNLYEIYNTEKSREGKLAIIWAFASSENTRSLERIIDAEKDRDLRANAIMAYANAAEETAGPKLVAWYKSETEDEILEGIVHGLMGIDDAKSLIELANAEKNPERMRLLVEAIANTDSAEAEAYLEKLLAE